MADDGISGLLQDGRAFADLSAWRKISVEGPDARAWLDALVSGDLRDLAPGTAKRSLLLSPTGRVRADFTVAVGDGSILLLQDPIQRSILDLLDPYVLSSDVQLDDRTYALSLFAVPGPDPGWDPPGAVRSAPSCLGSGIDLIAPSPDHDRVYDTLSATMASAGPGAVEEWRILTGRPRVGVDVLDEDLPLEAGLTDAVAFDKGCFTGQEAVAKVRNLGHPRRLLLQFESTDLVSPGDPILLRDREVGRLTSVVARDGRGIAIGRVSWDGREGPFASGSGHPLRPLRAI